MKYFLVALVALIAGGAGTYFYMSNMTEMPAVEEEMVETEDDSDLIVEETEPDEEEMTRGEETVIGQSVEGRDIVAHHYGAGDTEILFVGGIHGGYSWNTALVAYGLMDYLETNPTIVPENVMVTVIPVMNPDGLNEVLGSAGRFESQDAPTAESERIPGRFNANGVDLNRNFDCVWESEGTWRSTTVDAGDEPFSEPEAQAVRDYVERYKPAGAVVWYSAAGGVFASSCSDEVASETLELTNVYADASDYQAFEEFDFYEVTGDMVNWFAKNDIPAISVLLSTHTDIEWTKNRAGIDALLEYYATE